jgi:hypothetical protein
MSDEKQKPISVVFKSPSDQAKAVDILVHKRPLGWGRRSIAPYFNERCGLEMKQVLDVMIKDRTDQLFDYKEFQSKFGLNKDSLYLRVNQGIRYLLEMMDTPERTYSRFMEMCTVRKKHGIGIVIAIKSECRKDFVSDFKPKPVDASEDAPAWKIKMQHWLADDESTDKFFKEGLALTTDEINELKAMLDALPDVMHSVTSYSVKIIKTYASSSDKGGEEVSPTSPQ